MRFRLSLLLIVFFSVSACSSEADIGEPFDFSSTSAAWKQHARKLATSSTSPVGINVNAPVDWTTSYPFVDIFRVSRPFFGEGGAEVSFDRHGWIKAYNDKGSVSSPMLWDIPVHMLPRGDYVVQWRGKGKLQFNCAKVREQKENRAVIHLGGSDCGLYLKVKRSDDKDPIRDIRITMPGGICEGNPFEQVPDAAACGEGPFLSFAEHGREIVFNPAFLSFLRDFSVLRFMDAGDTNNSEISRWSERPTWADATWQDRGFPVEVIVQLGNTLKRDIWVTLPHKADDDYIRRYAEYVKTHLDPSLKVFIEYSNEVWNGMFSQNRYAREKGIERKLDENIYHAGWRYYSERSVEIFRIWEQVFGGADRLVRVMASQTDDPWMSNLLLSHKEAWKHTDALAIAGYFGFEIDKEGAPDLHGLTVPRLAEYVSKVEIPRLLVKLKKQREVASKYDLPLIAYEGGQHFVGIGEAVNDEKIKELFQGINRDPAIKPLYAQLYRGWKHIGGTLFVHYAAPSLYSKWGSWGIKEYLYEAREDAPKYDATLDFIEHNPKWW